MTTITKPLTEEEQRRIDFAEQQDQANKGSVPAATQSADKTQSASHDVSHAEMKDESRMIVTPRGNKIDPDNIAKTLAPDVWSQKEKEENENYEKAQRRIKAQETGRQIAGAFNNLVNVYGMVKGAHNRMPPPQPDTAFEELNKIDAYHAQRLDAIRSGRAAEEKEKAAREERERERARQAQARLDEWARKGNLEGQKRKDKLADDEAERKFKADQAEKDRMFKEAEGKKNRAVQQAGHQAKADAPKGKVYQYVFSEEDKKNPNYKVLDPDGDGKMDINDEHVAQFSQKIFSQYDALLAKKAEEEKNGVYVSPTDDEIARYEKSIAYKAASKNASGMPLTDGEVAALLGNGNFDPAHYLQMQNKPYHEEKPVETKVPELSPISGFMQTIDMIKKGQANPAQNVKNGSKPVGKEEKSVEQQPLNDSRAVSDYYAKHKPVTDKLTNEQKREYLNNDYLQYSKEPDKMQDKLMYKLETELSKSDKYGKDNDSPIARSAREEKRNKIAGELYEYYKYADPENLEKLKAYAAKKEISIEQYMEELAQKVIDGKIILERLK